MIFPAHKAGLYLTHNSHKDAYESVEQYFEYPWMKDADITSEEKQTMIDTDEVWELQWYPETPISSYKVIGPTLQSVLAKAKLIEIRN